MQGHRIGYIRVSTIDQSEARQLEGITLDKVFLDKASGKDTKRPQLELLMSFVRTGDTVVVHSMDRLARNLDDLRRLVQTLTSKGVRIEFVKPTGCATRFNSSVIWLESIFHGSPVFRRQRYFCPVAGYKREL